LLHNHSGAGVITTLQNAGPKSILGYDEDN